jgi:hypothetical protein
MTPDSVELPAIAVGGIVVVGIGIDTEGERREEAEAVMIVPVSIMTAIPVMIMIPFRPHASHIVVRDPARGRK